MADEVHVPEARLSNRVSLFGGEAIPLGGFGVILGNVFADAVNASEITLSLDVTQFGREAT